MRKHVFIDEDSHKKIKIVAAQEGLQIQKALENAVKIYSTLLRDDKAYTQNILNGSHQN